MLDKYKKYTFFGLILIAVIISLFLLKPFIVPIVTSFIVAYIFYPLHKKLNSKINKKTLSALIISIVIIALIVVPVAFIVNSLSKEVAVVYTITQQKIKTGQIFDFSCSEETMVCGVLRSFGGSNVNLKLFYYIEVLLKQSQDYLLGKTTDFLFSIPQRVLDVFITFFLVFFLLKDGKKLKDWINEVFPIKKEHREDITIKLNSTIYGIIYGILITALIQGIVGGIGFALFGVPSPILWGALMGFFALIPYIGTPIIWGPAAIILILQGYVNKDMWLLTKGIGLLVYGAVLISGIDNILKPKLIGKKAKVHPAVILLGIFGGLKIFGFIGIILGPLILALTVKLFEIYKKEV